MSAARRRLARRGLPGPVRWWCPARSLRAPISSRLLANDGYTLLATSLNFTVDRRGRPARLQFSAATYSVAENGGNATITITRTGGSAGAVGVSVATSNGTATAPADYTAVSQTVSFANGDTANKTVSIPIVNDTLVEANETVNLSSSNPTGGATLGSPSTAVLTITDNDGGVTLSASPTTVAPRGYAHGDLEWDRQAQAPQTGLGCTRRGCRDSIQPVDVCQLLADSWRGAGGRVLSVGCAQHGGSGHLSATPACQQWLHAPGYQS